MTTTATAADDVRDLASFGYRPALDRTLGAFSSFAAGFSYISILTGVFQMFYVGHRAAGPAFFWVWPVVFLGQLTVALCFAEASARCPLAGGTYPWARWAGGRGVGWMAGWVYLCGSVISLAAVALAPQATLPQISARFQIIGDPADPADIARNAVLLGCVLIAATTAINAAGVRLMARINNVGVIAELLGVVLLIGLLAARTQRGPAVLLDVHVPEGAGSGPLGMLGPFLSAALMASYVLYGFDTAGTLAEETGQPRRRAPRAILQALCAAAVAGGLLIACALLAVGDPNRPELGRITGGLPLVVKDVLGPLLGTVFLVDVVLAVFVCALAVHAGTVRLVFAMARDDGLPFARALGRVSERTRVPILPPLLVGAGAMALLLVNVNVPQVIETLCSVAIVWANLAYLLVTFPMLTARLRRRWGRSTRERNRDRERERGLFSMGRWGLPVNLVAVVWGALVVVNIAWPRASVYGDGPWARYSAVWTTLALIGTGAVYYQLVRRRRAGVLTEHAAPPSQPAWTSAGDGEFQGGLRPAASEG